MSSLLRSTKFVRYFTGAARTLILNSTKSAEINSLINSKALCASNNVLRDYSTSKKTENLEPLLLKLDNEVRRFGKITKKDIDDVFDELRSRNDITSTQSLTVIRCCGELIPEELPEQRTLLVQKIWNVLTERGVPMDISHYNALLKVYIENEHPFSPAKFLEELEMKGLQANRVTYQRLMWRYCQEGDLEGATKVLEKMRELQMPVSEPVLNALVMGHAFKGDTEGAKAVLDTMAGAGLQPSNRTYTLLACGYAKKGDIEGVENIKTTALSKDIYLSDKDLLDIIEHLAISGHGDKVDNLFTHLMKGFSYNQDARNLILRLISKGHVDIAKNVMKTMNPITNEELNTLYRGAFFIKQLLKLKMTPEAVVKTCKELQEEDIVPHSLYLATEEAFLQGQTELAQLLISEMRNNGTEIRQHYYWPLLAQKRKENDEEGLLYILRNMHKEGVEPNGETMKDYVVPYLLEKDTPHNVILKLQVANVYAPNGVRSVMNCLLESGKMKEAAELALQYTPRGYYGPVGRTLNIALAKTKDVESFVTILHVISVNPRLQQEDDADKNAYNDRAEVGSIVARAVRILNKSLIESLLSSLYSKGVGIDTKSAEAIQQYLGEKLTANMSHFLTKLTSSDLEPVPVNGVRIQIASESIPQLEHLYKSAKEKGLNAVKRYQKQLLHAYIADNNVEKVQSFLEELKETDFELTVVTLGQLFEFYCSNDNIEKAYECKTKLIEKDPGYVLNNHKLILMAHALVRADRHDEAIKFLKDNSSSEEKGFEISTKCWQLLNTIAEQKEAEKVKEMTKVLFENNYAEPTNVLLGPSIKAHLLQDDLDGALGAFEEICKLYRCTPWNREMMKALINKEDATKLQALTDLGTQIHGETNNLYELVLAFVECGRLQQARRILSTPGLQTRHTRLESACQKYSQEGRSECLEGLLEATKHTSHLDRSNIFYHLLVSYCKANETDKALGLWTTLQEEGEVPSDDFLKLLGAHLIKNNRKVPFTIPEAAIVKTDSKVSPIKTTKAQMSSIIEELIDQKKTSKAMDYVVKVMKEGSMPLYGALKHLLRNLAEEGNVEKIQEFDKYIKSENVKKLVSYNNNLTLALFKKGSGAQHIDKLLETVNKCGTEKDLEEALLNFPSGLTMCSVMDNEEILQKCLQIVDKAADKGFYVPANIMWTEYLIAGRDSEADLIWNKYLCKAKGIMYRRLLQGSYLNKDTSIIEKVIEKLKTNSNVTLGGFGNIYSRLIDIHLSDNKVDEAKSVYQKAIDFGVTADHFHKETLKRFKQALEKTGGKFEFAKIN